MPEKRRSSISLDAEIAKAKHDLERQQQESTAASPSGCEESTAAPSGRSRSNTEQLQIAILSASNVLEFVEKLFYEADADNSGELGAEEMAAVLKDYYKSERLGRSQKAVQIEVNAAMEEFDTDKSGTLHFDEFVKMVCKSDKFKFKLTQEQKAELLKLAAAKAAASACETPLPTEEVAAAHSPGFGTAESLSWFTKASEQRLGTAPRVQEVATGPRERCLHRI